MGGGGGNPDATVFHVKQVCAAGATVFHVKQRNSKGQNVRESARH
jgi:uncharacterized protein (DUF849 family)